MTRSTIEVTEEKEDGGFSGRCLELPAAISQGETLEELRANMHEAIELVLDSINEEAQHKMVIEVQV
jgi:predicted RNase H-like HicB family nuclease